MALTAQQHNEQIRTVVTLLSNGGLALFGAFAAVIYNGNATDGAFGMAFAGLLLMSFAVAATRLVREEG